MEVFNSSFEELYSSKLFISLSYELLREHVRLFKETSCLMSYRKMDLHCKN